MFEMTIVELMVKLQNNDASRLSFVVKLNVTVPDVKLAFIPGVDKVIEGAVVSIVKVLLDGAHAGFPSISYARQFHT
jgi:hypothetical protein